jgi:hypothetical protein
MGNDAADLGITVLKSRSDAASKSNIVVMRLQGCSGWSYNAWLGLCFNIKQRVATI